MTPGLAACQGRSASLCFLTQGMMEVTEIFSGGVLMLRAKEVFRTAPSISWGLLQVDRWGIISG